LFDIAGFFPGYANSSGAAGNFYLDTANYENGVHTIQWVARDDAGNSDGIGSRYFTVQNTGGSAERMAHSAGRKTAVFNVDLSMIPVDESTPIMFKRGYNRDINSQIIRPDENGIINIDIKELERVVVNLNQPNLMGFQVIGDQLRPLPVGSTVDPLKGVFYWQPGAGFTGKYSFVFVVEGLNGHKTRRTINIKIMPKNGEEN
jgi:hypothetical protein